ncbi:MAG TPA: hypothetical protein VGG57_16300 [Stellaceae bacterium]|jgi:hypothetical protein
MRRRIFWVVVGADLPRGRRRFFITGNAPPDLDRAISAILDGRSFVDAVTVGYHDDVRSLWDKFIGQALRAAPGSG